MASAKKDADDLQGAIAEARKTFSAATELMRDANNGNGLLGTLVNDSTWPTICARLIATCEHTVCFFIAIARPRPMTPAAKRVPARTQMTPLLTVNLLRVLFVTFCAAIGALISTEPLEAHLLPGLAHWYRVRLWLSCWRIVCLKASRCGHFPPPRSDFCSGLVFANLLIASDVLRYQSETTQWAVRLIVYTVFAYLGMMLAMRSNRDEFSLIIPYVRFARETTQHEPLVIDTNIIIDGRIADLCATGFLSRSLIVPRFVLSELQALADSRDPIKRERGRRGLDILNQLQRSREIDLTIHESESGDGSGGRTTGATRQGFCKRVSYQRRRALSGCTTCSMCRR